MTWFRYGSRKHQSGTPDGVTGIGRVHIAFSQTEGVAKTHTTGHFNFWVQKFPFPAAMISPNTQTIFAIVSMIAILTN